MSDVTIYHNPRCSKSRQTLQLLQDNGVEPTVVEYLKNPLNADQLGELLSSLGMSSPRDLMRKKEDEYKEQGLGDASLSDADLVNAMVNTPKLMERPVVTKAGKAAIGRPPESVLDIL